MINDAHWPEGRSNLEGAIGGVSSAEGTGDLQLLEAKGEEGLDPVEEEVERLHPLGPQDGQVAQHQVAVHAPLHQKVPHRLRLRLELALQAPPTHSRATQAKGEKKKNE